MAGPYVTLATICEKVLQEADGVISLIRTVDRIVVTATVRGQGDSPPAELPQGLLQPTLVVALRAGDAIGRHPVSIRVEQPTGVSLPPQTFDVNFEGGVAGGVNLILQMQIEALEGLYWFDVLVNDDLLTRVPLRVAYQRVPGAG